MTERSTQTPTEDAWSTDDVQIDSPSTLLSQRSLSADDSPHPQIGTAADTVTVYGNWKCPYTRNFVLGQLPGLVDEFVHSGDLSIRFRSVAYRGGEPFLGQDAPRATRAGLSVWEYDPESFWEYFMYVFANQPQERYEWAKPELLTRFAAAADVTDPERVIQSIDDEMFTHRLEESVRSADRHDIWSVPRVVYDETVTAPTLNPEQTREQLERARQ